MLRHGRPVPGELTGAAPARRKALVIAGPGPAREGTVRQLAASGYAVEQASPGFAAGAAAARFEPDVLVVHAEAPDGGESVRAARSDRELAATPVVALAPAEWAQALAEAGCAAALPTPPGDGALAAAVDAAVRAADPRASTASGAAARRRRAPRRRR
jgi:CheY-like chemotaxis protein